MIYRVKNGPQLFETAESRRYKRLPWVAVPNKHDGRGYRRVLRLPDGPLIYAAWLLILQVASKCDPRWTLADLDGALTPIDLADKTGFPESYFQAAFKWLVLPEIGWLEIVSPSGDPATPSGHPAIAGLHNLTEPNLTLHNMTEQKKRTGEAAVNRESTAGPAAPVSDSSRNGKQQWTQIAAIFRAQWSEREVRRFLHWGIAKHPSPGEGFTREIVARFVEANSRASVRSKVAYVIGGNKHPTEAAIERACKLIAAPVMETPAWVDELLKGIGSEKKR